MSNGLNVLPQRIIWSLHFKAEQKSFHCLKGSTKTEHCSFPSLLDRIDISVLLPDFLFRQKRKSKSKTTIIPGSLRNWLPTVIQTNIVDLPKKCKIIWTRLDELNKERLMTWLKSAGDLEFEFVAAVLLKGDSQYSWHAAKLEWN